MIGSTVERLICLSVEKRVRVGGQSGRGQTREEATATVQVSRDGGLAWGRCAGEARRRRGGQPVGCWVEGKGSRFE